MFFNKNCCFEMQGCNNNCDRECMNSVVEQPIQRCIERNICHKVEHICPIHTTIVNNHIIEHTYRPEYTCSEENTYTNIDNGFDGNVF